jgi:phosphoglycerate dehydrogenase-like enzyme
MKPGACLVNISRAEVVERAALLAALRSGRLGGFALDPLYEEPGRSDDELLSFENWAAAFPTCSHWSRGAVLIPSLPS